MTEQELAAIEARARAATPGPWRPVHLHVGCTPANDERIGLGLDVDGPPQAGARGQFALGADACFIALAREDVPALCTALRQAWAALASGCPHCDGSGYVETCEPGSRVTSYEPCGECRR